MNRDDEFIATLEDYLESFDGSTRLPDRVLDSIHAAVPRTAQARSGAVWGRIDTVISRPPTAFRWGVAAAALLVAAAIGGALIANGRGSSSIGAGPPSAAPPTTSPGPSTPLRLSGASMVGCDGAGTGRPACLAPGTYTLSSLVRNEWPAVVSFDVPRGWTEWQAAGGLDGVLVDRADALAGSGWGVMFSTVGTVPKDPCDRAKGVLAAADTATVAGLVSAMRQWPGFVSSTPTPISVDGHSGQMLELTSTRTDADCPRGSIWSTASGSPVDTYPMVNPNGDAHRTQFRILDVDGRLLVIRATDFPETSPYEEGQGIAPDPARHTADQVALHGIVDSISLAPAP